MFPKSIDTVRDAHDLIRHYQLHLGDFAGGTAEGFAAFLFVPGVKIWSTWNLVGCLNEYKDEVRAHASRGEDFDRRLRDEMQDTLEALHEHDALRARLAQVIRTAKFGCDGGVIWSLVAELATTGPTGRQVMYQSTRASVSAVVAALDDVRTCAPLLQGSPNAYEPGRDETLDLLIRMDIERLDSLLECAKPWSGREPETSYELEALFKLATEGLLVP